MVGEEEELVRVAEGQLLAEPTMGLNLCLLRQLKNQGANPSDRHKLHIAIVFLVSQTEQGLFRRRSASVRAESVTVVQQLVGVTSCAFCIYINKNSPTASA